jgi:hypothetical protein
MEKYLKISWLITAIAIILVGAFVYAHYGWGRAIGSALSIFFFANVAICCADATKTKNENGFNLPNGAIAFYLCLFAFTLILTIARY